MSWQLLISTKLILFSLFYLFKKRDKALSSGPLKIAAVTWAGFTIILQVLELPIGTSSTERERNVLPIYLSAWPESVIKHSISKVGRFFGWCFWGFFPFSGFVLSFENCIPFQVKIKQNSLCCAWVMVKDKKCPFMLSRIQNLEWELGRANQFKAPGMYQGWKLWLCSYSVVLRLLFAMQPDDTAMWQQNSLPPQ